MTAEKHVGLIGTGLLGSALAERLNLHGWRVFAFDVNGDRRAALQPILAGWGSTAADVFRRGAPVVLCLPNSDVVRRVIEDAADAISAGALLIDTTTGEPEATAALGERLFERGIDYLDATVVGSSAQAREGDIVMMVGGREEALAACRDLLAAWTERIFYLGPWGSGARMKLVVNLVLGLNRAVLAEGLVLAKACGLPMDRALEVLKAGAAYSRAMDAKGEKMVHGDFAPQAKLNQHHKDVRLILQLAERNGARTPLSEAHQRLLATAVERGFGESDNSAVIKAF